MTKLLLESSSHNSIASNYNEHATAHEILRQHYEGKKIPAKTAENMKTHSDLMAHHAKLLHDAVGAETASKELADQHGRAKVAAANVLEHRGKLGHKSPITHVAHTGGTGITAYGDTKQSNPSDIVIHHTNGKHLGVSLKSSRDGQIGFHNGGFKTVAAEAGAKKVGEDAEAHRAQESEKHFPGHSVKDASAKVKAIRKAVAAGTATPKEKKLHEGIQKSADEVKDKATASLAAHYNKRAETDHEGLKKHIQETYLKHNPNNKLDYIKVTGHGVNGKYQAHSENPEDNPMNNAVKNAKKFTFHMSGSYIHVVAHQPDEKKKHVFSVQTKFNEEKLGSSLKAVGQPSTKGFGELPDYKK